MKNAFVYETNIGKIIIAENGVAITNLSRFDQMDESDYIFEETKLLQEAALQFFEYFSGNRKIFTVPLAPEGTKFQEKVWQALQTIPYGQTSSYKEIADIIGQPNASRAVGGANNKNPIMIMIPCHRVIGANGKLVGYGGGIEIKAELLQLELLNK